MDENPEFAAIEQARDLVIDSIAETMDLYGITRSVGILYGTMYMRDEMTLDEMREELQMSKPSMSTGVKKLQDLNVVKKHFTGESASIHLWLKRISLNFSQISFHLNGSGRFK